MRSETMAWVVGLIWATSALGQMPEVPQPTEEHRRMHALLGAWDADLEIYPAPGAPVMKATGVENNELCCGGLWVVSEFESSGQGMVFQGHGLFGYDSAAGEHVGVWVDSMQTRYALSEGSYDPDTRKLTMISEGPGGPDGGTLRQRQVETIVSEDQRLLEFFDIGTDGEERLSMRILYRRR